MIVELLKPECVDKVRLFVIWRLLPQASFGKGFLYIIICLPLLEEAAFLGSLGF
jgi:hypothetical protein